MTDPARVPAGIGAIFADDPGLALRVLRILARAESLSPCQRRRALHVLRVLEARANLDDPDDG